MSKITTCLWFQKNNGEEAADYYVETFNSAPGGSHVGKKGDIIKTPKASEEVSGRPEGSVLTAEYELDGVKFMALNGGPYEQFKLNGSTSFIVECETQEEIDHFWEKLSSVPEAEQCGWCTDKFGVTWQIVPKILDEFMKDSDPAKVGRVTACFMPMKKLDIAKLEEAANA